MPFVPQHLLKVVRRCPGHEPRSASTSISSRAAVRTRAATRTTCTNRTAPTTSGEGAVDGYAIVNLGARYRADATAAADRAGEQPVRSPVRHRRAARARRLHRSPATFVARSLPADQRRVPRPADDLPRRRSAVARLGWCAPPLLNRGTQAGVRCVRCSRVGCPFKDSNYPAFRFDRTCGLPRDRVATCQRTDRRRRTHAP